MEKLNTEVLEAAAEALRDLGLEVCTVSEPEGEAEMVATLPTSEGPRTMGVHEVNDRSPGRFDPNPSRADTIIAHRHVTADQGALYRALNLPYVDSGGNAWIKLPGLFVHIEGRKPTVTSSRGPNHSSRAFTPAGLRVVFILLVRSMGHSLPVRRLADDAGVSVGAAQAALDDLQRRKLAHRSAAGGLTLNYRSLTQAWLSAYRQRLAPRLTELHLIGPSPEWWLDQDLDELDAQFGGEIALKDRRLPLRPSTTMLYGEKPWAAVRTFGRLTTGEAPNVILRERFWSPRALQPARSVPSLLVYADAISSGDARQLEVAGQLWERDAELRRLDDRS